jgi:hypothetical protein
MPPPSHPRDETHCPLDQTIPPSLSRGGSVALTWTITECLTWPLPSLIPGSTRSRERIPRRCAPRPPPPPTPASRELFKPSL